jgi:hypothetical protein
MEEFLQDLVYICPEVNDFKYTHVGFQLIIANAPKFPQQMFHKCVLVPYQDQILSRNENFLLNEDYSHYSEELSSNGYSIDIVDVLKHVWRTLDAENKETVWKYLHILQQISAKCT